MDGLALLGLLLVIYAVVVVLLAVKKPSAVWDMGKIKFFRKILGEKGTEIFFYILAVVALGFGIWLLVK